MEVARRAGRIIGILILAQMAGSATVEFVLEAPLFGTPGFLESAAPHARQIGLAALLGMAIGATWLGIAVTIFPILWERARAATLWLFALSVTILALGVVENAAVMSMVSVSEAHAKAGALQREGIEAARVLVAAARNWPHFMVRFDAGVTIFLFNAVLYRLGMVPRALTGFGMIAATLMIAALAMPLLGYDVIFAMLAPVGLSQLALALWLVAKGFGSDVPDAPEEPRSGLARPVA